jgi:hypothetical protein
MRVQRGGHYFWAPRFRCACFDLISLWDLPGFIRIDPIVKSSPKILNTQTSTEKSAWPAALIGPAIELSYGNPGERKRPQCNTKPDSNSNPEI